MDSVHFGRAVAAVAAMVAAVQLQCSGETAAWPGGRDFTVYNVVAYSPGREAQAAADAVELKERTGIDVALYSLSLHPTGSQPMDKARRYIESFRAFRRELEGKGVHAGVLVQSILGHSWARVADIDDSWTAAVDCKGRTKRYCSASPGFAAYITEAISMLAREKPEFILTDDDVRAFSHDAECFCARHVALFNSRRGTSYTSEELRAKLAVASRDDPDFVAFCGMQREMQANVNRRIRAAIDSVDPSIPGGICIARTEQLFCAENARTMAAKGQTPLMRACVASYMERMSAANAQNAACRMLGFAEYYKDSGIDILCESDTFPHNLWSKSSRSLMTHMATAAFAGMKGAKAWYLNGHVGKVAVSRNYTDVLARNRGFLQSLAAEVKGSRWEGMASPCFTNFPAWHVVTNQFDFFVEPGSAAGALFPCIGVPYRVSREFDEDGIYALQSAAEVARLSDDDLRRMFSHKVVVFGPAALAIARRGLWELTGVKAERRDLYFTSEHVDALDADMPASMKDGTVAFDVLPGAKVLATLGSRPFYGSPQYTPATPSAVLYDNALGGRALSLQYHVGVADYSRYSVVRRASMLDMLGELNGEPLPFTLAHDQDITVLVRRREDGARILFVENLNSDPVDRLAVNVPAGDWRVERLCGDGEWRSVGAERDEAGRLVCDVGVGFYEAVALRMSQPKSEQRFSRAGYWDVESSPRRVETLTTGWEFSLDGFRTSHPVSLPHSLDEDTLGYEASGGVNRRCQAWYRRRFRWSPRSARQFLHFEAIMGKSRVTLNGREVARHFGGYLPIHAEVTGLLEDGENLLEVWCDNSDDPSFPPGKAQNVLGFVEFGGIYRDAYLVETGEAYVADPGKGGVRVTSSLGADGAWTVRADVTLGGDAEGAKTELYFNGARVVSPFRPESPKTWSPESPNLHFLRVDVRKGGRIVDSVGVRFGIRDFAVGEEGMTLNGRPYGKKLIGVNRHQDWLFIGNALPNSLHWRDVKKYRDCGMNVFRCAHYPQDPAFMDACDELGMFVIVPTPGWQFWNGDDPAFERRVYDDVEQMVRRDRSHPSLLMWEPVLNETHGVPMSFYTNVIDIVRRETLAPNNLCVHDRRSRASGLFDLNYMTGLAHDRGVTFNREWGDFVDDWHDKNSLSRVAMEWGEGPMVAQAQHYMEHQRKRSALDNELSSPAGHIGGTLWHGADHALGYFPDNFYGGILTYARQKKYSWYAFKAALTEAPFVFVAHELAPFSPGSVTVYSNCAYSAKLCGEEFVPGKTKFDYIKMQKLKYHSRYVSKDEEGIRNANISITLPDGSVVVKKPAGRVAQISLGLDTEGLAPVADGGDLVAAVATLADASGAPKRYDTEKILFTVDGAADIVGENPQQTRWGEAVVLIRPHRAASPSPIKVRAELVRKGYHLPPPSEISFVPGRLEILRNGQKPAGDEGINEVEREQFRFDTAEDGRDDRKMQKN